MLSKLHQVDIVRGRFRGTGPEDLSVLFARIEGNQAERLVVHFHGGLVSRRAAQNEAEHVLLPAYKSAGAYPIFFLWNSDLITAVTANLDAISQEPAFQRC